MEEKIQNLENDLKEIKSLLKEIVEILKTEIETETEKEELFKSYVLSGVDEAGSIYYYGYLKKSGDWIIEAYNTSTGERKFAKSDELIRRTKKEKNYENAWTNRAQLQYFYFYQIF